MQKFEGNRKKREKGRERFVRKKKEEEEEEGGRNFIKLQPFWPTVRPVQQFLHIYPTYPIVLFQEHPDL